MNDGKLHFIPDLKLFLKQSKEIETLAPAAAIRLE